ncbi:hypothetical protein GUJ93_ZPchr0007g3999 [Zizania palustris]|uniref:Uncharacterized protein n=1 Tax=Zizania palustris TaxID=103762 RepID=A0A8J5T0S2_ZIZPA|nr:hypothetical protein GUJ93_ZPchr0007g3999 [Zizania palustris]
MDDYGINDRNIDGIEGANNAPAHQSIPDDNMVTRSIPIDEAPTMPSNSKNAEYWKHFEAFKELQNGQMVDHARQEGQRARNRWVARGPRTRGAEGKESVGGAVAVDGLDASLAPAWGAAVARVRRAAGEESASRWGWGLGRGSESLGVRSSG